jgi:hypothetical protein
MSTPIRFIVQLIGYTCVATVVAALIALAYLWQTGALTDEKVFQMVALIHDVDLQKLEEELRKQEADVPPEEASLDEIQRHRALEMRNFELKSAQLQRNVQEFEHLFNQIQEAQRRIDNQAKGFKDLLAAEEAKAVEQGNTEVVNQWELMTPAQVKDLIMTMRENNEVKDVVMLLRRIDDLKKRKILAQFNIQDEEEMEAVYEIQSLLREGFPKKGLIDAAQQQEIPSLTGPQG